MRLNNDIKKLILQELAIRLSSSENYKEKESKRIERKMKLIKKLNSEINKEKIKQLYERYEKSSNDTEKYLIMLQILQEAIKVLEKHRTIRKLTQINTNTIYFETKKGEILVFSIPEAKFM